MSPGPLLLVALLAQGAALCAAWRAPRLWLALTVAATALMFSAALLVLSGVASDQWSWVSTRSFAGDVVQYRLDALSAWFLALLSVIGGTGAVYAREYWTQAAHPRSTRIGRLAWSVIVLNLALVLGARHGLHFLMAWELFTLSAYFLISLDRGQREVRAAGWLYLVASHTASLALFAFFTALAAHTGSWALGPMHDEPGLAPLFWLALFGFGLKAGLFPLHIWLPSAHASAPSHVSALMSGMTIKIGIYGLVRFSGWLPVPSSAGWVVAALGVVSAVLGVAFALGQHDLKRLLAYHSVENIGIILIGLGFAMVATAHDDATWGGLALAGGLLHVWNHGLFKALLFLGAGSILHACGTREMSRLGGLWRAMPWTASLFALGAVAISGLPPLNGFVSEWLVYLGLIDAVNASGTAALVAVAAAILLAMTGALALACFAKVCGVVFLGAPRSAAASHARECGWLMRGPMVALAAACVAIGLAPVAFWPALSRVVGEWNVAWAETPAPVSLVNVGTLHVALGVAATGAILLLRRRVALMGARVGPTWDCGYAEPSARMQYTAGSFADTITGWFAPVLRPQVHAIAPEGPLPIRAAVEQHTPETVLDHIVTPVGNLVLGLSQVVRRLQHGRVQAYVLYLVAGVAALTLLMLV